MLARWGQSDSIPNKMYISNHISYDPYFHFFWASFTNVNILWRHNEIFLTPFVATALQDKMLRKLHCVRRRVEGGYQRMAVKTYNPYSTNSLFCFESCEITLTYLYVRGREATDTPSTTTIPSCTLTIRNKTRKRLDLPEPVRPTIPTYKSATDCYKLQFHSQLQVCSIANFVCKLSYMQ